MCLPECLCVSAGLRPSVFGCACVCLHVDMDVYLCVHARSLACEFRHVFTYVCVCLCVHVCLLACVFTCVLVFTCVCMCVFACLRVCLSELRQTGRVRQRPLVPPRRQGREKGQLISSHIHHGEDVSSGVTEHTSLQMMEGMREGGREEVEGGHWLPPDATSYQHLTPKQWDEARRRMEGGSEGWRDGKSEDCPEGRQEQHEGKQWRTEGGRKEECGGGEVI